MILKTFFLCLFLNSSILLYGQLEKYVIAKNGLIVRDAPSTKGKRIGKFLYGNKLKVLEKTNEKLTITNEGEKITGNWVKVSPIGYPYSIDYKGDSCYVFNGFLSKEPVGLNEFKKSKKYTITKLDPANINKETYRNFIYLKNSKGEKVQRFNISSDTFDEEYCSVKEIENPGLTNVKKIIQVVISHCACYCNDDLYYWFLTTDNKWVRLPTIEHFDMDIGNPYNEYVFTKGSGIINLLEYKDQLIDKKKEFSKENIIHIYTKQVKTLFWNGENILVYKN